jgi:hypothetical protein
MLRQNFFVGAYETHKQPAPKRARSRPPANYGGLFLHKTASFGSMCGNDSLSVKKVEKGYDE